VIFGNFLNGVVELIHIAINVYIFIIIIRAVISWVGTFPTNNFVIILRRLTDPVFRLVHRYLPFTIIGGIDISPIIIVMVLYFIDSVLLGTLGVYARQLITGG
jgi:YggT family protein